MVILIFYILLLNVNSREEAGLKQFFVDSQLLVLWSAAVSLFSCVSSPSRLSQGFQDVRYLWQ